MTTPRPKLDLFNDSPCLLSKKCRTSTPSIRPPKPPTKSTKNIRRQRGYFEHRNSSFQDFSSTINLYNNKSSSNNNDLFADDSNTNGFPNSSFHFEHPPYLSNSNTRSSSNNNNNNNNHNINNNYNAHSPSIHDGSFSVGLPEYDIKTDASRVNGIEPCCRLFKQFQVIGKIGSGDFADVYEAKSYADGQYYAIKRSSIPFTSNSDRLRKLQEVRNHQLLPPHRNCVRYVDSWEEDGFLYIQTELCRTSLNGILETSEEHKLSEQTVWGLLLDLLLAVKHLHDHDLIHMDIKPDNIFISFDNVAKLGDFGLMCSCLDLNSSTISYHNQSAPRTTIHNISNIVSTAPSTKADATKGTMTVDLTRTSKTRNGLTVDIFASDDSDDVVSKSTIKRYLNDTDDAIIEVDEEGEADNTSIDDEFDVSFNNNSTNDHDDSGIINRSDESIDSIDEGDSKYLASETMQGKFTKAADIFSLGITIFEVASGLDLPKRGEVYHKLRHNEIEDLYFNGLSADLIKIIKLMMEEDYTKRPTIDELLQHDAIRSRRPYRHMLSF